MIRARLNCDVHRIEAADPYPDDYEATVRRNVREQGSECAARHRQAAALDRGYGTILLASPIWKSERP